MTTPKSRRSLIVLVGLAVLQLTGAGCAYLADRGRDFSECWRIDVGTCLGMGATVRAAGLLDVGIGWSTEVKWAWVYGHVTTPQFTGGDLHFPVPQLNGDHAAHLQVFSFRGDITERHGCWLLLPALLSETGRGRDDMTWIWTAPGKQGKWARVHAFDAEVALMLPGAVVRLGVSPGEVLDFLLGWFGVDIAGDDSSPQRPGG